MAPLTVSDREVGDANVGSACRRAEWEGRAARV